MKRKTVPKTENIKVMKNISFNVLICTVFLISKAISHKNNSNILLMVYLTCEFLPKPREASIATVILQMTAQRRKDNSGDHAC